jgi:hypothetical protein
MAKVQNKRKSGRRVIQAVPEAELPQRMNYVIIIAGVVTLLAGFLIMSSGDAVSSLSVTDHVQEEKDGRKSGRVATVIQRLRASPVLRRSVSYVRNVSSAYKAS